MALYITGGLNKNYPAIPRISDPVRLFGMETSRVTVITPFLTIALVVALVLLINHTKIGMAMRAVSVDFETAQLMGIRINSVISFTFIIGSALAAIAGVLLCSTVPTLQPTTGSMPGIKAVTAAVFGGIGSIPGAMLGGILLGLLEQMSKTYISTLWADAIVFAVLVVVRVGKPTGLLGKPMQEKV